MEEIEKIHILIQDFSKLVNQHKELSIHKDNKFNKQFGNLLKEWNYIKIIIIRIESADPSNDTTQLGLDLKSLYVFGRVFSESLLYLISLFIKSSPNIDWTKIGPFLGNIKNNIDSEPDDVKNFWKECGDSIENLYQLFKYRNDVLHEKDSDTEWTFAWPGKSNLDHVFISNVPWEEDRGTKKEKRTLNARDMADLLLVESSKIIDYLNFVVKNDP